MYIYLVCANGKNKVLYYLCGCEEGDALLDAWKNKNKRHEDVMFIFLVLVLSTSFVL